MPDSIHQLIDEASASLLQDMTLTVTSLEGVYATVFRADPTQRGFRRFLAETAEHPAAAHRLADAQFDAFEQATVTFRTSSSPENPGDPDTRLIAPQQLRVAIEALRFAAARRFRAALLSRSTLATPSIGLAVMNRAGAQIKADDMLFLLGRKAMIDIFNQAQIEGLVYAGETVAQVQHKDPDHETNGLKFQIADSESDLPHYSEIADKWFHPRSGAIVARSE